MGHDDMLLPATCIIDPASASAITVHRSVIMVNRCIRVHMSRPAYIYATLSYVYISSHLFIQVEEISVA